ncbi:MAG: agmatine deiminase family protein [Clostridia bacterium]|nr:agmatine deiminase family protein [Clostridia bacterium]
MLPKGYNYKMPPEWAKHKCTFMEWPIKEALWPEPFEEILPAFADVANTIAEFEPVYLIAKPDVAKQALEFCSPKVKVVEFEHDDSWIRDNGPTFVVNPEGKVAGINWIFNAWGGKYPCENDNLVAPKILDYIGVPRFDVPIVMEGGSIHVDGEGTLLTTEECLLNKNRNPHISREEIEDTLKQYLGVEKFIWLRKGLYGDDTDGHVDNVACFAKPGIIIMQTCSNPNDPNYEISRENIETLKKSTDAKGRRFEIVQIEQPPAAYYEDTHLTLSYLNFYFVNGGIILPVFGGECSETDKAAESTLAKVFPDRKIAKVNGIKLVRGGGNVHCLTQQMPEGTAFK